MADQTLGTAVVDVGADLSKLVAAFAEARRMRDQFDADMVAQSGGLMKLTEAAAATGDALDKQAQKTKATGDAAAAVTTKLTEEATAHKAVETASKAASSALETEAQKNERLSAVIDRTIARANEQRIALTRAGESSFLGATVPRETTGQKPIPMSVLNGTAAAAGVAAGGAGAAKTALEGAAAIEKEAKAVTSLTQNAHISGGVVREMLVVIREIGRGDFTRLAGSASILAQRMGLLEAVGLPVIGTFATIAAAVGIVGYAYIKGSDDAEKFDNMLRLSGNYAGLTASSYTAMAQTIERVAHTSVASNEGLISSLAKTNDFTAEQIGKLTLSAQRLSKATGESAEDILKDFERMAQGPTAYAEAFQHAHTNIITPAQLQAIRELEERGEKERALALLIADVNSGVAKNTVETTNQIKTWWSTAANAVSDYWLKVKQVVSGTQSDLSRIQDLNDKISLQRERQAKLNSPNTSLIGTVMAGIGFAGLGGQTGLDASVRERDALLQRSEAQRRQAEATAETTRRTREQNDAVVALHGSYGGLIDSQTRFNNDVAKLKNTLRLAEAANPNDPLVKQLRDDLPAAIEKLRKQDLPAAFKAGAKAAREAESEAKKLARQAEALEERRQHAIGTLREEGDALASQVGLYQDQTRSLDDVNRAKAIAAKLSELKLSADSKEGQEVARLITRNMALTASIEDETKARAALESIAKRVDQVKAEDAAIGSPDTSGDAGAVSGALRAVAAASKRENDIVDAALREGTIKVEEAQKRRTAIVQREHDRRARIEADATNLRGARSKLNTDKLRADYEGTAEVTTSASDIHGLDQALGGRFKRNDDLKKLEDELRRQRAIVKAAQAAGIYDAKQAQDRLTEIERQGANKRKQIKLAEGEVQIAAATSTADSLTSIVGDLAGKQSAAYKAMFAVSKAFAIADSIIKIQQALASATASLPFPANLPAIAEVAALGAGIVANITSVAGNFAEGGLVRGSGSGTSDDIKIGVSDQEFVVNQQATMRNLPMLRDINAGRQPSLPSNDNGRGGPNVTVHNYAPGVAVEARPGLGPNDVILIAKKVVASDAPGVVGRDMSRPNSDTSKAVTTHFDTSRRRG